MKTIPRKQGEELDLHALRVLDVLLRERSLTRAAEALNTQQPALSKTLGRLRRYFDDPLFVRVAQPYARDLTKRKTKASDTPPQARKTSIGKLTNSPDAPAPQ